MRRYNSDTLEGRILTYIVNGNLDMIKSLLELKFLDLQYDTFNTMGSNSNENPEDRHMLLEVIAMQSVAIPRYKEMIDLILSHGSHVDDHANAITPLQLAIVHQNYKVAAYLQLKGGTFNLEEINAFSESVRVNLLENLKEEFNLL